MKFSLISMTLAILFSSAVSAQEYQFRSPLGGVEIKSSNGPEIGDPLGGGFYTGVKNESGYLVMSQEGADNSAYDAMDKCANLIKEGYDDWSLANANDLLSVANNLTGEYFQLVHHPDIRNIEYGKANYRSGELAGTQYNNYQYYYVIFSEDPSEVSLYDNNAVQSSQFQQGVGCFRYHSI